MEENLKVGDIVKSLSGHDKNDIFIVVDIDKNGYIAIIDGKYRQKSQPKKKNPKHLLKIAHDEDLFNKTNSPIVTNAEIYKAIKAYKKIKE